jgi:hypothetical protein
MVPFLRTLARFMWPAILYNEQKKLGPFLIFFIIRQFLVVCRVVCVYLIFAKEKICFFFVLKRMEKKLLRQIIRQHTTFKWGPFRLSPTHPPTHPPTQCDEETM